jgi:hypothetical protein
MRAAIAGVALLAGSASAGSPERPQRLERGDAGSPSSRRTAPGNPADCAAAAIADIELAQPEPVDEIQVFVRDGSSSLGAADVTVASDRFDRVLRVRGGSHGLTFYPALTSSAFRVSLLPALEEPGLVCVDRIELRRAGHAVATITP